MKELLTLTALIFLVSMIVNVVLNTIKSIAIIKGTTFSAAIASAIAFGFYTFIVKQIADTSLIVSMPMTAIANFLGVYIGVWIVNLFKKDKLWRITCTITPKKINSNTFMQYLDEHNISYNTVATGCDNSIIDIFSYTQAESEIIKKIITEYKIKYSIVEIEKFL